MGFVITDPRDKLLYQKYKYFEKGIPAHLFRKDRVSDIQDVTEISRAIENRKEANKLISDMMNGI